MDLFPSEWKSAPLLTRVLALAVIPLVLGGVLCLAHFSASAARSHGPDVIAQNTAGDVLLGSRDTLMLVAADGHIATFPRDELGLTGDVMSVSSDGTNWYIGEDGAGMLHQCNLVERTCRPALQFDSRRRALRRAHAVAFTEDRIYITDSEAHQLLAFDRNGRQLTGTRTEPVALCFPNSIVALDGDLYIADTNNLRIARIDESDIQRSETFLHVGAYAPVRRANCAALSARLGERGDAFVNTAIDSTTTVTQPARPPARRDRVWPASILRTSVGDWWVIQHDNRMRMGDLIIYDESGTPKKRVPLPEGSDPIDMIETSSGVLVTDFSTVNVHRVSLAGEVLGVWEAVRTQLDAVKHRRDRAMFAQHASQIGIGLGALVAVLVVALELQRQRRDGGPKRPFSRPTTPPLPLRTDIHWIGVEPKFLQRARRVRWLGLGLTAAFGIVGIWLFKDLDGDPPFEKYLIWVLIGLTMVLFGVGIHLVRHVERLAVQRIGVSEREVLFDPGTGLIERAAHAEVRVDPTSLLLGKRIIQLTDQFMRTVYPKDDLESYLLARLPPQVFTKYPIALMFEALRRGNASMWLFAIGFVVMIAIQAITSFNRGWLKHALASWLT